MPMFIVPFHSPVGRTTSFVSFRHPRCRVVGGGPRRRVFRSSFGPEKPLAAADTANGLLQQKDLAGPCDIPITTSATLRERSEKAWLHFQGSFVGFVPLDR